MRPRFLDRFGVDDRLLAALLLTLCLIGCEIPIVPVPDPLPPIPVPVVTTDATLIVIEETSERSPEAAAILGDVAFWNSIGAKWRFYDDDSPDATVYLPLVTERPGLVVLDKAGKKTWSGALPTTQADIRKLVK